MTHTSNMVTLANQYSTLYFNVFGADTITPKVKMFNIMLNNICNIVVTWSDDDQNKFFDLVADFDAKRITLDSWF